MTNDDIPTGEIMGAVVTIRKTRAHWSGLGRIGTAGILVGLLGLASMSGARPWPSVGGSPGGPVVAAPPGSDTPMVLTSDEAGLAQSESEAVAQAIMTGQRVEIGTFRTERREVYANPDGTTTAVEHAQPVRVARAGRWFPVDTTLVRAKDGSVVPRATTLAMRLSGGGAAALVTTERAGRSLSLDWPGDLPTPALDGNQATYPEVLAGVDLVVTVRDSGFSHVLVVKTPQAATNPKLAALTFEMSTKGLSVKDNGAGGLAVVDSASGGTVLEAPTPMMWDSGTPTANAGGVSANALAAPAQQPTGSNDAGTDPTGSAPDSAKRAPLGVSVAKDRLTLVPDRVMLADPGTRWPVYLDPVWESTANSSWAMVAKGYPNQPYWKFSGAEGMGRCPQSIDSSCNSVGVKRLFYALPTPYGGKTILSAEFRVTMTRVSNSGQGVTLIESSGGISSATNWNNQPAPRAYIVNQWPSATESSCTGANQNVGFDATPVVRDAVTYGWSTTTFGLSALDESTESSWKRFCGNAILSVRYNRAPDRPADASLTMSPGGVCVSGAGRPYVDTPPTLYTVLTDPDSSSAHTEQISGEVSVSWEQPAGTTVTRSYGTVAKGSGSPFQLALPADIPENVVISWQVRASDGTAWGEWSRSCEFVYDHTQPAAPDIDSPEYLPLDATETTSACAPDTEWRGSVGVYGTFTFDSVSTDAVTYRYGFNTNPSPNTVVSPAAGGDPASVTWLPEHEGPNFVTVEAVDRAGLSSTIATCVFAVTARPAAGAWALGEATGSAQAADTRGTHPATPAVAATFGVPGPGCHDTGDLCQLDHAVRLTGAADSYLTTTSTGLVDTETGFSVAAWVRLSDTTADHIAVSQDGSGEPGFTLGFSSANRSWVFGTPVSDITALGGWSVISTAVAAVNEWTHLVGAYDPVKRTLSLYVNGQAQPTAQRRSVWKSRGAVQIGRRVAKSGYTGGWVGDISDVAVFDRIVVPAEVREMSTLLPVRKAYWPLNEAVEGYSPEHGGGEDLQLSGGAGIYAPDLETDPGAERPLIGTGHLVLDGIDDLASTTAPVARTDASFTVSFRVKIAAVPQRPMAVVSQAGVKASGFVVRCTPDRWELSVATADVTGAPAVTVYDSRALPTPSEVGHAIAIVYNAYTNELRLYVDGQLTTTAIGTHTQVWQAAHGLQIGRALVDGAWKDYFAGVVDDVRVYDGVVDPSTVEALARVVEDPSL